MKKFSLIISIIYFSLLTLAFVTSSEHLSLGEHFDLFSFYLIRLNAILLAIYSVWVLILPMKLKSFLIQKYKK